MCRSKGDEVKNIYRIEGDKCYIYLKNIDAETVIDKKDLDIVNKISGYWRGIKSKGVKTYYVASQTAVNGKQVKTFMHRLILNLTKYETKTDHIDHDTLNNTRENIKQVTNAENCQNRFSRCDNTSGFRGVIWHKAAKKWVAQLMVNQKNMHLGCFNTPEEAHKVYIDAVKKHHSYVSELKIGGKN